MDAQKNTHCPTCGRSYTNGHEIEFIETIGECSSCDHIRGEAIEQTLAEIDIEDYDE